MAEDEVRVGDIGTVFELQITEDEEPVNVSQVVSKTIIFKKPDKSIVEVTATFTTNGTDGLIRYKTVEQEEGYFIDQGGRWEIQGEIATATETWRTDIGSFWVHRNLV